MTVSKAMFKKEKCLRGNYVQEKKAFVRKLNTRK